MKPTDAHPARRSSAKAWKPRRRASAAHEMTLRPRGSGEGFALVEGVGLTGENDHRSLKSAGNLGKTMAKTMQKPSNTINKWWFRATTQGQNAMNTFTLSVMNATSTQRHTSPNGMSSLSFCVCAQVAATL